MPGHNIACDANLPPVPICEYAIERRAEVDH